MTPMRPTCEGNFHPWTHPQAQLSHTYALAIHRLRILFPPRFFQQFLCSSNGVLTGRISGTYEHSSIGIDNNMGVVVIEAFLRVVLRVSQACLAESLTDCVFRSRRIDHSLACGD
jgi:hypothetical protein